MNPSEQFEQLLAKVPGWQAEMLKDLRETIESAGAGLTLEWKWGTAVWSKKGNICALGAFKDHLKVNFFKGASLPDPDHLFNSGLDAKQTRTIDLREGDQFDRPALQAMVRSAVGMR